MSDDKPDLGVRHRTRPAPPSDPLDRLLRVVGPIEPGSLIVMDQRALGFDHDDTEQLTHVLEALGDVIGHRRWLLLMVPDAGAVQVLGPDEVSIPFRELLAVLTDDRDVETFYSYDGRVGPPVAHDPDCGLPADHAGLCAP